MSLTCVIEQLPAVLEELKPHFEPHWAELAQDRDRVPLSPQYSEYLRRAALGEVLCAVLREKGAVVGYFVGFIAPGLHYSTTLTLTMDIAWLHPSLRAFDSLSGLEQDLALKMIFETALTEARRRGVKRVYLGTKLNKDIGALYEVMGFSEVERYYSALIGG